MKYPRGWIIELETESKQQYLVGDINEKGLDDGEADDNGNPSHIVNVPYKKVERVYTLKEIKKVCKSLFPLYGHDKDSALLDDLIVSLKELK